MSTTFTLDDIKNAKVIGTTLERVTSYFDGEEIDMAIDHFDSALDECQLDVRNSGEPRLLIIQIKP